MSLDLVKQLPLLVRLQLCSPGVCAIPANSSHSGHRTLLPVCRTAEAFKHGIIDNPPLRRPWKAGKISHPLSPITAPHFVSLDFLLAPCFHLIKKWLKHSQTPPCTPPLAEMNYPENGKIFFVSYQGRKGALIINIQHSRWNCSEGTGFAICSAAHLALLKSQWEL